MTGADEPDLNALLRRLRLGDERPDLVGSLRDVLDSCVALSGVDGAGIMIEDEHGALRYVVATDGPGRLLEAAQADVGEGPCVDTFVHASVVRCRDVTADPRYPQLERVMLGRGVGAVIGIPVRLAGSCVGSLDLYRSRASDWTEAEAELCLRYGQVVETVLGSAVNAHQAGELVAQLQYALDYRVPIERGVGYLMARDHVPADHAFARLRSAARANRRKVGEVAQQLLDSGVLPGE